MNKLHNNAKLPLLTELITNWHHDRNLIEGETRPQVVKLLEEFTELVASVSEATTSEGVYKDIMSMLHGLYITNRIKPVTPAQAEDAYIDSLGDMFVLMVNLAEKRAVTIESCIDTAWSEIKDRKGRLVEGIFVKEADL